MAVESQGYIGIVDRGAWEENSKQILADIAPVAVVIKVSNFKDDLFATYREGHLVRQKG